MSRLIDADALIVELQKDEDKFDKEAEDARRNSSNYTKEYISAMSSRADGIRDAIIEIYDAPTIEPKQADDLISRADAIKEFSCCELNPDGGIDANYVVDFLKELPSAQPKLDEWCTDCKEYNQDTHSCPRWNRVIRKTAEEVLANNQPKRGEWIPCSERLPKRQGHYICTCKDGSKYKRTTVVKWSNGWQLTGARAYWIVLAWMPLPKPWKGADDAVDAM